MLFSFFILKVQIYGLFSASSPINPCYLLQIPCQKVRQDVKQSKYFDVFLQMPKRLEGNVGTLPDVRIRIRKTN